MASNTGRYATTPLIGPNMQRRTNFATEIAAQEFALGTTVMTLGGFIAIYVLANGAIAGSNSVSVSSTAFTATSVTAASSTYTNFTAAFASGDFGWVFKTTTLA